MQMARPGEHAQRRRVEAQVPGGAVADVEDEGARAVLPIAHEGAAGGGAAMDGDGRDVDAVAAQALDVECAEIVVADGPDQRRRRPEPRHLVDEDGRRARGEGPTRSMGSSKPSPGVVAMISTRISPMATMGCICLS